MHRIERSGLCKLENIPAINFNLFFLRNLKKKPPLLEYTSVQLAEHSLGTTA
jgi:hypothetical protein